MVIANRRGGGIIIFPFTAPCSTFFSASAVCRSSVKAWSVFHLKSPRCMRYIQYGCGLSAPDAWINYDVSPTLWLQRLPLIGGIMPGIRFPKNVRFGNIVKGLPEKPDSADGIYCSHVLEHLTLQECRTALTNTFRMLKPGGIFRCVLPDLEVMVNEYVTSDKKNRALIFVSDTLMGLKSRPKGIAKLRALLGNERHLWMWDEASLSHELAAAGFIQIRRCNYNDCSDPHFKVVENSERFRNALALEATKAGIVHRA